MPDTTYTIPSDSPPKQTRARFSRWEELFEECRRFPGQWRRTKVAMRKSTALQLASDVRNAHKRVFKKSRLKGLRDDERWESAWGTLEGVEPTEDADYFLWVRYMGKAD